MKSSLLENKKTSRKGFGLVLALLGCAAVLAVLGGYEASQAAQIDNDEAALTHMESLISHRGFLQEQHDTIGELIEEGIQNQIAVTGTLAAIGTAVQFYQVAKPIIEGVAKVWHNVVFGDHVTVRTINPEKIDKSFNDSKIFVAEIKKRFPASYDLIAKVRQDMKLYQFDLSNIVDDVKLMTDSTINDVRKSQKTLNLRKKILVGHKMSPTKDLKVWDLTIKGQVNNLTDSIMKCDKIIKALEELQKNTKHAKDTLDQAIDDLRKQLEANNKSLKIKLADLEKKMKSIGCVNNGRELLRAIFTLGLSCLFDSNTKREFENVKVDLREEQTIIQAMSKRMTYFDDLKESADTLVKETAGVLDTTKTFRQALVVAKNMLENDYSPEDVAENMGDVDFANDFAEALYESLDELRTASEQVGYDCLQRKQRLVATLTGINKYFG